MDTVDVIAISRRLRADGRTPQLVTGDERAAPGVFAIVGMTGSGKSSVAMRVARRRQDAGRRPMEIVAIDAFTIYRGMSIATAKPSDDDRAAVAHHLLDVVDPDTEVTVAWFRERARKAVETIHERDHDALLVGGSGLYFRAVVDPLTFPPTDPEVRARLEAVHAADPAAAHALLASHDPDAAAKIDPGNLRRTVRALEVLELTGQPFSAYDDAWAEHDSIYASLAVRYLEPAADDARARIRARAETMVATGLLDEARDLQTAFGDRLSTTARQAIGYAEAFAVLEGTAPETGLVDAITVRTWQYARRQRQWFRRDPRCAAATVTSADHLPDW